MLGWARDEFLRRYATSPIHVPRLERLLAVYGVDEQDDSFCQRFIGWDRACADGEAARVVTEIVSAGDAAGRIARLSEEALRGAIRWMSDVTWMPMPQRARLLRDRLAQPDERARAEFVVFLETAGPAEEAWFRTAAESIVGRMEGEPRGAG